MTYSKYHPVVQALLASVFFATSIPAAKILLGKIDPVIMAALLYLGSGIGLLLFKVVAHRVKSTDQAGLAKADVPWLIGAICAGGIAAPIVLMFGLRNTPAATASLLMNFEGVATSVIAAIMFKEALGKRIGVAVALITAASVILSWDKTGSLRFSIGAIGIIGACVLWGLDNNVTRHISAKGPLAITIAKGFSAGIVSLGIALALGNSLPSFGYIVLAAVLGFFAYGMSIVFFISAMRNLGAARTSAYFGTAPFIGALLSFIVFKQIPDVQFLCAVPIMLAGVICLLNEKHEQHAYP
ncbi:MAG: DMT family transporter [Planctomycetales bacterium]|nr:DMT family transporter [Planctomycetales bacterium]